LPAIKVIPVSANERYGLMELVDAIVHALPNEQKAIVLQNIQTADDIRKKAAAEAAEVARKEAEEARRQAEEAHKQAMAAEKEKRNELEKMAREAEERRRHAEEIAEQERKRARKIEEEQIVSSKSRKRADDSFVDAVLDFAETIPVVGGAVRFFRRFFS